MQTRHANSAPTVVGYVNKELKQDGQLLTAQFLNVGSTESFWVSDLKVVGYENNSVLRDNSHYGTYGGEFYFYTLNEYGIAQDNETYGWCDEFDGSSWGGGYWDGPNGSIAEPKDEADKEFTFASGVWFYVSIVPETTDDFRLVSAGEVAKADLVYDLQQDGNLIGNPMPTAIKLSAISVNGYQNNSVLRDNSHYGTYGGEFYFYSLNEYGIAQDNETYGWCDEFDGSSWGGGYWDGPDGAVSPEENDIDIEPGDCYWFYVSIVPEKTDHFTFELPSPLVDHTAKE